MNRRGFFGALAAIAATATLDPERLLWVPGKKLISIPPPVRSFIGDWTVCITAGPSFAVGDVLTFGSEPDDRYMVTAAYLNRVWLQRLSGIR
jgi:hypothetical protein